MAYSDYGAYVYCNNLRREDKEDVALFATDEETFGMPSAEIGSGSRIWVSLGKARKDGVDRDWIESIHHGTMGDGNIRVLCHKYFLPEVYERCEDGTIHNVDISELLGKEIDNCRWGKISFKYKGYSFRFKSGEPNEAEMTEPDGTQWFCEYDYCYGAGFDD